MGFGLSGSLGGSGLAYGSLPAGNPSLYPRPQRSYLFKDLYKEIIIRSLKREVLKGPGTL